jgi:hypothetical protein
MGFEAFHWAEALCPKPSNKTRETSKVSFLHIIHLPQKYLVHEKTNFLAKAKPHRPPELKSFPLRRKEHPDSQQKKSLQNQKYSLSLLHSLL